MKIKMHFSIKAFSLGLVLFLVSTQAFSQYTGTQAKMAIVGGNQNFKPLTNITTSLEFTLTTGFTLDIDPDNSRMTFSISGSSTTFNANSFDIIFSGGNFGSLNSITKNDGLTTSGATGNLTTTILNSTTIRLTNNPAFSNSGNNGVVVWDISASALSTITSNASLSAFTSCAGSESAAQNFTVSGSDLTDDIYLSAPTGYEISTSAGSGYENTLTLTQTGGSVASTTIYVRLSSSASGSPSGNITMTSTGANTKNVAVSGTVNALPSITLGSVSDISNTATNFSLPYTATTGSPDQYSITTGSPTAMPSFSSVSNDVLPASPISVTIPASAANTYDFIATVKNSTTGCVSLTTNFTVNVVTTTINSIAKGTPSDAITNANSVTYTITFGESVTGLSTSNFSLTTNGVSGASIGNLSGSGDSYTLEVNTGTGSGSITLNLDNATGLTLGISTALPFAGETYTIDKTLPTVITQDRTVYLNASGTGTLSAAEVDNGSSDDSGIASLAINTTTFTCANIGTPATVTLTVTDNAGNSETGTASITVLDTIKPVVTTQNRTVQITSGGTITVSAGQIDNGSGDACGIASMSLSPNTFTCANSGANTVTLTVTDVNGNIQTETATVTVQNSTSTSDTTANVCKSYNWYGTTYTTSGNKTRTITNAAGCDSIITLHLTIYPIDTTTATPITICKGDTVDFYGTDLTVAGTYYHTLQSNITTCDSVIELALSVNLIDSTNSSVAICKGDSVDFYGTDLTVAGTYYHTLQSAVTGCDSIIELVLSVDTINLSTYTSKDTITAVQSGASYQWIDCDNGNAAIVGETDQTFVATQTGNYAVIVTNGTCSDTSACVSVVITSNKSGISNLPSVINIYPNPNNGLFTVSGNDIVSVTVFNTLNQIVFESAMVDLQTVINLEKESDGIYFVKVVTTKGIGQQKIIKQ